MQFWHLILDSFRESRDRKIFWIMLMITVIVAAAMFCVSFQPGKIDFLFGAWIVETKTFSTLVGLDSRKIAGLAVNVVMDMFLGWMGVLLALIATAGFFPAMMEKGAIDVVLAKPISRPMLFLGKYLGTMTFFLFQSTVFILLTFVVIGVRWHVWLPGYLLCIPLLVILFSYLYCISALTAVITRSTMASILICLGAWVVFFGIQTTADYFDYFPSWKENKTAYAAVNAARWCTPKTHDITYLAARWSGASVSTDLMAGDVEDEETREMVRRAAESEGQRMALHPAYTIGSSLLFEVAVLLLAFWKFSRCDF